MSKKIMSEAATIKARAQSAARALKNLLAEKTLPEALRKAAEGLHAALKKSWADLEADSAEGEKEESGANMGDAMYAELHMNAVRAVDYRFGDGYISVDEYGGALQAVELALATFRTMLMQNAPGMFARKPWEQPVEVAVTGTTESEADGSPADESEGAALLGDAMALMESVVRRDGTIPVKIIQPGWGSSGYYPAEVLERDGPKVFQRGMHMYWNHPTAQEEAQRPERDLNALAGVLSSDARWNAAGPAGPGLYADAKVMPYFADKVEALAPHIGLSIRAMGKAQTGEAEGKSGPIITELSAGRSVDYVTAAGAGGEILSLFEAARTGAVEMSNHKPQSGVEKTGGAGIQIEEANVDELKKLQEANATLLAQLSEAATERERLNQAALAREAGDQVRAALEKVSLHAVAKARLSEGLVKAAPVKDGKLDGEAFKTQIGEAVAAEVKYLTEASGLGRISGMGAGNDEPDGMDSEKAEADLTEAFRVLGLSESAAKSAAQGRK